MSIFNDIYQSEYPAVLEPLTSVDLSPIHANDSKQHDSHYPEMGIHSSRKPLAPLLVLSECVQAGLVFRGFIPFADDEGNEKVVRVVAKLVQRGEEEFDLVHEAEVYRSLQKSDIHGIPYMIGIFHDIDDDLFVLVTTDVGIPFQDAAPIANASNMCVFLAL